MRFSKTLALGLVVAMLAFAQAAQAGAIYHFERLTNTNSEDLGDQLTVEVIDVGGGQVAFKFTNPVGIPSSITDIYFDDGTLLGIASIVESGAGVNFTQNDLSMVSPPDLPAGNNANPDFETTAGFSADSDMPITANGVNLNGESVTIIFNLINGKTYADTIAALNLGPTVDSLRIGLHVQAIGTAGQSDSYITKVPDGGTTLSLLGLALTGLGMVARRRKA